MVVKVDGNSQGYKLNLRVAEEEVPVSRAYAKEMKALIENRTKELVTRHRNTLFVTKSLLVVTYPGCLSRIFFLSYTLPLCLRQETQRM